MSERRRQTKGQETKTSIQVKREEEMLSSKHPAEALRQVRDGPHTTLEPAKILALQQAVGNQTVQRLLESAPVRTVAPRTIQRHMSDEAYSQHTRGGNQFHEAVFTKGVPAADKVDAGAKDWRAASNVMVEGYNDMVRAGTKAKAEPCGAEATEGGEDIYEGGGE